MPKVSLLNLVSLNPALCSMSIIVSPCGKASMVAVRYEYALLSFDIILPQAGKTVCE